jgi:DNA-directed RNA polymerase specialized sigma24 family protein
VRTWSQNPESFEQLLHWLGSNREVGAIKYEAIRKRLISMFSCRGCYVPEELTDEVMDRVSRSIAKTDFVFEGDQALYFYGVARNVHLEWLRREKRLPTDPLDGRESSGSAQMGEENPERLHHCLEKCLDRMPRAERNLLLQYYHQEGGAKIEIRKKLANQRGLSLNGMRIHLHRLRHKLRDCVERCVGAAETK